MAADACGATVEAIRSFPEFRRLVVTRGNETTVVDLVIDRAPSIDPTKVTFGDVRVDTLREIAANKLCTLVGRSEIKDLVDFERLLAFGIDLESVVADATLKDRGADSATVSWVLDQVRIGPSARLPGGADPVHLETFRLDLVKKLRALAMREVRRS
jgi:hypothetical protein